MSLTQTQTEQKILLPRGEFDLTLERSRLGKLDLAGIILLTGALLVLSYIQAHHTIFWGDEIMGDYVLRAGSWHRFLELWRAGIDSSGFWFYVFAKPWEWVFGPSELSLRMFSASGVALSAAFLWVTARRFYNVGIVALAVSLPYLCSQVLRWQLANGRCYGVLMAACALTLWLVVRSDSDAYRKPGPALLVATFLAYDILAGSHILGILFAGMFLAVQILRDLFARRLRPLLYLVALVGIGLVEAFSLGNIHSTTALGKPAFWTSRPILRSVFFMGDVMDGPIRPAMIVLILLALLHLRRRRQRDMVYVVLLAFLLLHTAFFVVSRIGTSIYVDRYMVPFFLGLALLVAELLTQIRESSTGSAVPLYVVAGALIAWGVWSFPRPRSIPLPFQDYTTPLLAELPPNLPVVDTDVGSFVEVQYYHHGRMTRPFLFPLDGDVAVDRANVGGVSGFHEMENFDREGLDTPDLQSTQSILARYPEFIVLTAPIPTTWFKRRILDSGQYVVTDLGRRAFGIPVYHAWDVKRREPTRGTGGGNRE